MALVIAVSQVKRVISKYDYNIIKICKVLFGNFKSFKKQIQCAV